MTEEYAITDKDRARAILGAWENAENPKVKEMVFDAFAHAMNAAVLLWMGAIAAEEYDEETVDRLVQEASLARARHRVAVAPGPPEEGA